MGIMRRCRDSQEVVDHWTRAILDLLLLLTQLFKAVGIIFGCSVKNIEEALTRVAHFEHTSQVSTTVAVVGSTPDRAQAVIVKNLVPFLAELVCA